MAKLHTADIFKALRVVKATGAKEELKPILHKVASGAELEDLGIEAILTIMEAASGAKAEAAIYDFLSAPFDMSPDMVAELELDELIDRLEQMAAENDIRGFFGRLSGLMSKN